ASHFSRMYSALLIVSSASAKGMQDVLTDDADRTTAFAWEGSYRTNRTIDQREICVQRRVRFASARLQTCKEISPLSQNYIRLKTGCPIIYLAAPHPRPIKAQSRHTQSELVTLRAHTRRDRLGNRVHTPAVRIIR